MSNRAFQKQPGNSSLDGYVIAQGTSGPIAVKANFSASADPTVDDDSDDGYSVGSIWINTSSDTVFLAANVSVGAAVWKQVGISSGVPDDRSVTPSKISVDFGGFFRNKIKNPDLNVSTNGTSYSTPSNGASTLDKWLVSYDGSIGSFVVSQQSHTIGQTDVPDEPEFFIRWNHTSAGSGSSYRRLENRMENCRVLAHKTATVTFYAKADSSRSVVGSLVQSFGSGGSSDVVTSLGTFSVTTSWQKFTATVSVPTISGKTIGSGNYLALRLALPINTTMTVDVSHVQVEENGATPFEQRPLILEQFMCIGLVGTVSSVDASGGVEVVAGTPITSAGTIRGAQSARTQSGTSDTFLTGDRGKLVTHSNGSAIAATLPQAGASFPSGWFVDVQNRGAGTVIITPTTSTIDGASSLDLTTGQGCRIFSDGTNYFTQRGGAGLVINSVPTGALFDWSVSAIPTGYLECDGSAVSRSTYANLFATIGTVWGVGDGSTTFNLPDFRGRTTIGKGTGSGLTARTLASTGGEETHAQIIAELAAHTHTVELHSGAGSGTNAAQLGPNTTINSMNTGSTGSGTAFNVMQPYAVVTKIIKI